MAAAEEDEQLRPTYFELAAAESLVPSLKAALSYSLSVRWPQRAYVRPPPANPARAVVGACTAQTGATPAVRPRGRSVCRADAPGGALPRVVLPPTSLSLIAQEYNSLTASDASVGESFYGASRVLWSVRCALALTVRAGLRRAVGMLPGQGLTMRQRWLALLGLVLVPYIKAKAEREYVQRRGGVAASMGLLDDSPVHGVDVLGRA